MHELSIVQNILEIADREVRNALGNGVEEIALDVGSLAGIEMEALSFAWQSCVPHTVLEGARRTINIIPAEAKCRTCLHTFSPKDHFDPCPTCGAYFSDLIRGKELQIRYLIVNQSPSITNSQTCKKN